MKTIDLFGNEVEIKEHGANQIPGRNKSGGFIDNPMHLAYGIIETERCKTCIHIVAKHYGKVYYKCELRKNVDSCSVKSDHRVNWRACGKYEKEPPKMKVTISDIVYA
jgi:hypothetical protein